MKKKKMVKAVPESRVIMDALVYVLADDFEQDITTGFISMLHRASTLYLSRNGVPRLSLIKLSPKVTVANFSANVNKEKLSPKLVPWITHFRRINVINKIKPILDSYIEEYLEDEAI